MEELLATYGYPAIVLGTFLEGETVVLVGGYLASRDYLSLTWVAFCAFLGTWIGDTLYFWIGRRWGGRLLEKRPGWRPSADRALRLLQRYDVVFILSFRFFYGIRTVSPFVIGMSGVAPPRFIALNLLAAIVWAVAFSVGGYALGSVLEALIGRIERYEAYVLAAIAGVAMIASVTHLLLARRRRQHIPVRPASGGRDDPP